RAAQAPVPYDHSCFYHTAGKTIHQLWCDGWPDATARSRADRSKSRRLWDEPAGSGRRTTHPAYWPFRTHRRKSTRWRASLARVWVSLRDRARFGRSRPQDWACRNRHIWRLPGDHGRPYQPCLLRGVGVPQRWPGRRLLKERLLLELRWRGGKDFQGEPVGI